MDKQALDRRDRLRVLNDQFRQTGTGRGSVVITAGVSARGLAFVAAAVSAVRAFTAFAHDNDPYGEHDFGALDLQGARLFFKLDYYDLDLKWHSPDATDPAVTNRVLTIMLASEY